MVVEDEKSIAQILAFNLMQAGYAYEIAFDGEEGLNKAIEDYLASQGIKDTSVKVKFCEEW